MSQWLGQQGRAPDRWERTRGAAMPAVGPGVKGIHTGVEEQRVGRETVVRGLRNKVEKEGQERNKEIWNGVQK